MRNYFFIIFLILCLNYSYSSEDTQIEILKDTHQALLKNNLVWPGFDLQKTPSVVHFESGNLYAFNLELEKGSLLSDSNPLISFSTDDLWGIKEKKMQPNFPIGDQHAFIFGINSNILDVERPILTFVHERFHLHQFEAFHRPEERFARYMDEWNETNQVLIGVENWLLTEFLKEKRIESLKDFVAISLYRREIIEVPTHAWENLQQRMEGLADYVSFKTFEIYPILESFDAARYILESRENKLSGESSILTDAIKSRHYFVGATIGFALDFCEVQGWKEEAEKGVPLQLLLAQAFNLSDTEIDQRINRLQASIDYAQIQHDVLGVLAYEKEKIQSSIEAYQAVEGIVVGLAVPRKPISGGGDVQQRCYIGKGITMNIRDTSISTSQDQDWQISFKKIPYMVEDQRGVRTFKLSPQTALKIDEAMIDLHMLQQEDRVISFNSLEWDDNHSAFACTLPGKLHIKEGKVFIQFINDRNKN